MLNSALLHGGGGACQSCTSYAWRYYAKVTNACLHTVLGWSCRLLNFAGQTNAFCCTWSLIVIYLWWHRDQNFSDALVDHMYHACVCYDVSGNVVMTHLACFWLLPFSHDCDKWDLYAHMWTALFVWQCFYFSILWSTVKEAVSQNPVAGNKPLFASHPAPSNVQLSSKVVLVSGRIVAQLFTHNEVKIGITKEHCSSTDLNFYKK